MGVICGGNKTWKLQLEGLRGNIDPTTGKLVNKHPVWAYVELSAQGIDYFYIIACFGYSSTWNWANKRTSWVPILYQTSWVQSPPGSFPWWKPPSSWLPAICPSQHFITRNSLLCCLHPPLGCGSAEISELIFNLQILRSWNTLAQCGCTKAYWLKTEKQTSLNVLMK